MQELVSRTFIGTQAQRVRWMPSGTLEQPDPFGPSTMHRFIAIGSWTPELRGFQLGFYQLDLQVQAGVPQGSMLSCLTDTCPIYHTGAFTDLQVVEMGMGRVLVLTASSDGHICWLMFQNLQPDASLEDMLVNGAPVNDTLEPWVSPHTGVVSSVDVSPQKKEVLSCGQDGGLHVTDLATSSSQFSWAGSGCSGFTNARWLDSTSFATSSGTAMGLQIWDVRSQKCVQQSPSGWGHTGCWDLDAHWGAERQIFWLDVHPSRPSMCATANSGGTVALWDLRFQTQPLNYIPPATGCSGDVWEVQFDTSEAFGASSDPPIMYCTEDGFLGRFLPGSQPSVTVFGDQSSGSNGTSESIVPREAGAVNSFDVEPTTGQDIIAVTSHEGLVYLCRPAPSANRATSSNVYGAGLQQPAGASMFGRDMGRSYSAVEAL